MRCFGCWLWTPQGGYLLPGGVKVSVHTRDNHRCALKICPMGVPHQRPEQLALPLGPWMRVAPKPEKKGKWKNLACN
eukprot:scaffold198955_cov18-Tisochrysis_lutea.AAC.1